jgi:hypothetical protein
VLRWCGHEFWIFSESRREEAGVMGEGLCFLKGKAKGKKKKTFTSSG